MAGGRPSIIRVVAVIAVALAVSFQVVRSAVVNGSVIDRPEQAENVWPSHPRVQLALAMAEIGQAAGAGRLPADATIRRSLVAARRAPLAIEPLLIASAVAQSKGQGAQAEALLVEAVRRDPRSAAARFLLAQRYLSTGQAAEGLLNASVLVRMTPGSNVMIPAIAKYAQSPDAAPVLRRIFSRQPALREAVMAELARDAKNYALVMALANEQGRVQVSGTSEPSPVSEWQTRLLRALVQGGEFNKAYSLWLRISGLRAGSAGIFNPGFADLSAPAPFNWTYGSGDFGVAEPAAAGGLQIIYYGRSNADFANQTTMLAPGSYELRMRISRDSGSGDKSGLTWSISCLPVGQPLVSLPIGDDKGPARAIGARFTVPAGCTSQQIRLFAIAAEFPSSEQVRISDLQLVRLTP